MAKESAEKTGPTTLRTNERKWGKELLAAGWTMVPSVVLERQQALGLDAVDINILLHIARHWWLPENLPFPSKKAIADCMAIHPRTVQRRIAAMEGGGLIKRIKRSNHLGQRSNFYDLSGLIDEAKPYAAEALRTRKANREERASRRTRKRVIAEPEEE